MKRGLALILTLVLVLSIPAVALGTTPTSTQVRRLEGANRYETATKIADELAIQLNINFALNEKFDNVVLASGNDFPDALSGAPLAKQLNAPILLVDKTTAGCLVTLNYIKDHVSKTGNVYILGGTPAVPDTYIEYLNSIGYSANQIHRLGGKNRDETSLIISKELNNPGREVVLVSDSNFYDALTAAPAAGTDTAPILLVSETSGPTPEQKSFCDQQNVALTLGELTATIDNFYTRTTRITGANRYDTNYIWSSNFTDTPVVYLATGEDYPDALAGAVLAGQHYTVPIILTHPNTLQPETAELLNVLAYQAKRTHSDAKTGEIFPAVMYPELVVFGSSKAISDEVVNRAQQILNSQGYPHP